MLTRKLYSVSNLYRMSKAIKSLVFATPKFVRFNYLVELRSAFFTLGKGYKYPLLSLDCFHFQCHKCYKF